MQCHACTPGMHLKSCLQRLCDGRVAEVPHQHVGGDGLCPFRDESTVTEAVAMGTEQNIYQPNPQE